MMNFLRCWKLLFALLIGAGTPLIAQQHYNMPLLSNWDDDSVPGAWTGPFNECYGYHANGREYAFLGSTQGTYFFDITNPENPALIDFIRTKDTLTLVVNKDYATSSHYLYAVSDQGDNSLQIFDLQFLPDSVIKVYDNDSLSKRCHNIYAENNKLYMCSNTRPNNTFGPTDILSISDPENPFLLGTITHPDLYATHDAYVINDTAYLSNGNAGLWVFNTALPATPSLIAIIDVYPEKGYNHNAWLSDDSQTLVFTDENHGRGVKVFDVSDIHDPHFISMIRSNLLMVADSLGPEGSVAHNALLRGDKLFISYYHDGVQVFDISDRTSPVLIGYYDTAPETTDYYSYTGCWGVYPFLPSGNIIASDINNGLFILDGSKVLNYGNAIPDQSTITFGPNPVTDDIVIYYGAADDVNFKVELFDVTGRRVGAKSFERSAGTGAVNISASGFSSGIYIARISSNISELNATIKFLKSNK